jgi:EmrB/QacA subfamily drug resistance transporter
VPPDFQEFALTRRQKVFTLAGTLLGLLLAALDQTIVATAGPAIQRDLAMTPAVYPWITSAYLVASTVMVPIYGKLSDVYGRKAILLLGIALFIAGSAACGMASTTSQLIAARALQGVGSASLFTSAFAVVADIFPPADRGKYQGIFGGCFALSSVVGPLVGGFLTDNLSWHWVFFVNLPLGAIAVTFIVAKMPALKRPRSAPVRIDVAGALFLLLSVVPFLVALSFGHAALEKPSTTVLTVALAACSVVGGVFFLRAERRAPEPLLDLRLFRNRVFAVGNLAIFVLGASFLGAIVFLPLFMVNVVGLSATRAGLTLTPLTLGIVAGNVLSGQLVSRLGHYKRLMLIGNVVLIMGFALLGFTLHAESSQAHVTIKMIVLGLGLGPSIPLYVLAIQNAVDHRELGVATAAATFFRQIGATVGVTALGAVFAITLALETRTVTVPVELRDLPPPVATIGIESPSPSSMAVDAAAYRARIQQRYAASPELKARSLAALADYDRRIKQAFTSAIAAIYQWGLLLAVMGLLITLLIPEYPLRRGTGAATGAE